MTELTRRQMRELERNGQTPVITIAQQEAVAAPTAQVSQEIPVSAPVVAFTSRRQLRESGSVAGVQEQVVEVRSEIVAPETEQPGEPVLEAPTYEKPAPIAPKRLAPVPPVGSRRALRETAAVAPPRPEPLEAIEPIEVEIPEDGFRGANYLGEPSTQSIMLEVAPEAISLPLDTGEVFTTGSIAILPEAPGPSTGGLDGPEVDTTEDAVTGVLSIVDPVSAKTLIDERSPLGVVPEGVLRKGWWRPWLVGILSVVMAAAAIYASITILNALGI